MAGALGQRPRDLGDDAGEDSALEADGLFRVSPMREHLFHLGTVLRRCAGAHRVHVGHKAYTSVPDAPRATVVLPMSMAKIIIQFLIGVYVSISQAVFYRILGQDTTPIKDFVVLWAVLHYTVVILSLFIGGIWDGSEGKCVLLGVSGSIAAYKMANVASALRKLGADVEVIMTKNATQFITPITFETLTGHKCMVDTFDRDFKFEVTHISLAKKADVILVAPATANVIAKMAHGIADDMLTTVVLAAKCPKLVSPAMNTGMLENPITQDNIATLEKYGFTVIPSESGVLACKDVGSGRLPKEDVLLDYIFRAIAKPKDLAGLRIAVTAGPTQEPLDPVRYLTNHSTGKMGYAVARAAAMRGAEVTLIHGPTALQPVRFTEDVPITTAQQMYEAVTSRFDEMDVLVMAAAVADYRPAAVADDKIKKKDGDLSIAVERTPDILGTIGPKKRASSSAASRWRRGTCWPTPRPSSRKRTSTWWWPTI